MLSNVFNSKSNASYSENFKTIHELKLSSRNQTRYKAFNPKWVFSAFFRALARDLLPEKKDESIVKFLFLFYSVECVCLMVPWLLRHCWLWWFFWFNYQLTFTMLHRIQKFDSLWCFLFESHQITELLV